MCFTKNCFFILWDMILRDIISELSWWDGKQSFGFVFKREFFSWYLLLCLLIEFEVKISLYMLISPHIVSHYSLVGLIAYYEDAGLWEVWTLTIWPLIFESPHIGSMIIIFKSSDLGSITFKSFEDLLLEVLSSHKKEVVLRWALKEDWLYGIACMLSHKNSKCLISCCMIALLSFWDWVLHETV